MTVNERIKIIIDTFSDGVPARFAKQIGVSATVIASYLPGGRESKPSYEVLIKILDTYKQLSTEWLLSGEGPMLKGKEPAPAASPVYGGSSDRSVNYKNKLTVGGSSEGGNNEVIWLRRENESLKNEVQSLKGEIQEWKERYNQVLEKLLSK